MNNGSSSHPPTSTPQHHPYRVGGVGLGGPSDQLPPNWGVGGSAEAFKKLCEGVAVGNRNGNLLRIAIIGRGRLGIESDDLAALIHAQLDGDDPLDDREIDRAIAKAEGQIALGDGKTSEADLRKLAAGVAGVTKRKLSDAEKETIFRLHDAGERWFNDHPIFGPQVTAALYYLSPRKFPPRNHREQAALMVERLGDDPNGYTFVGDQYSPRDAAHVLPTRKLAAALRAGEIPIPPQVIANQFTGGSSIIPATKDAPEHESMGTLKEILHRRYTVVEFDGDDDRKLPLDFQAKVWLGGILTERLMPVLLVWSGSKSLHGIIRLLELTDKAELERPYVNILTGRREGTYRDHYAKVARCRTDELTPDAIWKAQRKDLEAFLCSSDDPLYRLDPACKDATRQTRLAGHKRADTGKRQGLIYLTYPEYPLCGDNRNKDYCGVCAHWGDCPYTNPASVYGTTIMRNI